MSSEPLTTLGEGLGMRSDSLDIVHISGSAYKIVADFQSYFPANLNLILHEAVKGWGNNAEHSFSCSKCHNAHSSGLGRLMRTNCLNFTHRGQNESGGEPGYYNQSNGMSYPRTAYYYGGANWLPACHNSADAGGGAWNDQEWNMVTPW